MYNIIKIKVINNLINSTLHVIVFLVIMLSEKKFETIVVNKS